MKTKENNFKQSLIYKTPSSPLFKMLGLEGLENDLDLSFSNNLKFINIKVKKSDLLFQIPLEKENYSLFENHPDYKELCHRYQLYNSTYLDKIRNHIKHERLYLKEHLPDIDFYSRIRIKSPFSYNKKMNDKIIKGEDLNIYDIIGERIIVTDVNESKNPELLEKACYDIAKCLDDFRKTTDFKLKTIDNPETFGHSNSPYISKDYISNPKNNGYQSLHILSEDSTNPDCSYETQIRTYPMEEKAKKDEQIAHSKYKARYLDDSSILRIPKYIEITDFPDKDGLPSLYDIPPKYAFHHYYGLTFDEYKKELDTLNNIINLKSLRKKANELNKFKITEKTKI